MKSTLEECLHKYDMESLHAYCDEFDVPFKEDKDAVCTSLAQELLKENVLLQRMGILDDASLQGLHDLMDGKDGVDDDVLDHLDGLDLIYGSREEQKWLVPEEVQELTSYENEKWNLERRSRVWLMQCLTIIQHEWADAPMGTMMELYRKNPKVDANADLKKLFQEIPVSETTCVMIGDSFVIRGWRTSEVFAGYRQKQKKHSFYMPEVEEVLDLYQNDYDTRDAYGQKVKDWFLKNGAEEDDLQLLLHEMWNDMNYGHAEAEIMKEAESMIVYDNKQEQEQFRHMMHAWYIHVHRMDLRGHSIAEQKN
jgi:hypothetical protein